MCCHVGHLCDCTGIIQPQGSLLQFIVGGRGSCSAREGTRVILVKTDSPCAKNKPVL